MAACGCSIRAAWPRPCSAPPSTISRDKLKQGHSSEKVTRKIPVYVAYFTAWPDAAGKVEYFADVYDRDARLKEALTRTSAVRHPERLVDPVAVSDTGAAPASGISDAELEAAIDAVN